MAFCEQSSDLLVEEARVAEKGCTEQSVSRGVSELPLKAELGLAPALLLHRETADEVLRPLDLGIDLLNVLL